MEGDCWLSTIGELKCYFNPLPPHGGRQNVPLRSLEEVQFQSTPSAWRETPLPGLLSGENQISIHSLRMEGDTIVNTALVEYMIFQSTPSAWRETGGTLCGAIMPIVFQSTPSAWRETRTAAGLHSDLLHFNPLPPHGGRPKAYNVRWRNTRFQSTPSAWRETYTIYKNHSVSHISIHSLRMEGDATASCVNAVTSTFQSTPSAWRETFTLLELDFALNISIHSLRMEGDPCFAVHQWNMIYFNPLPPHGGRPISCFDMSFILIFQSTPSAWRETASPISSTLTISISIHSLRMEGDIYQICTF